MNLELLDKIYDLVEEAKLEEAIEYAETKMSEIESSDFHKIIGKDLLHLQGELKLYVDNFVNSSENFFKRANRNFLNLLLESSGSKKKSLKAIYCEMNGFSINYDLWFIDLFAYSFDNGLEDRDWLAEFEYDSENSFTITGLEEIQEAYKDYHEYEKYEDKALKDAADVCEFLIILRLQQLFKETLNNVGEKQEGKRIPVMITAHDHEVIYRTLIK